MGKSAKPFVISDADLLTLNQLLTKGKESVRKLNRARALQLSHQGYRPQAVNELLNISVPTVYSLRKRYREQGLQRALTEKARPGQPRNMARRKRNSIDPNQDLRTGFTPRFFMLSSDSRKTGTVSGGVARQ